VFPQRHSQRFNVLGCLLHGELVWQGIWARVDAAAVICFMNELVKRLRRRTILVLDNASVHNCKILRTWQDKWRQCGLEFYFLPAYCPELNLIEGLWRQVKYHWYPFSEANAQELEDRIVRILRARGDAYARNLAY
jgi:hypothetical protein